MIKNIKYTNIFYLVSPIAFLTLFILFRHATETKFHQIKGVTINTALVGNDSKGNRSIEIRLNEYPDVDFEISGSAYYAISNNNFLINSPIGTNIELGIKESDRKHLVEKNTIYVYSVSINGNEVLTKEAYLKVNRFDFWLGIFLFGLLVCFSFYKVYKNTQTQKFCPI